jgi:hypothetical protein
MTSTSPESKLAAAKKDAGEDWILDFPESVAFEIPIEKKVSSNLLQRSAIIGHENPYLSDLLTSRLYLLRSDHPRKVRFPRRFK